MPRTWALLLIVSAAAAIAIDQLSKFWIRSTLDLYQSVPESGFLRLTHVTNDGAAFGLFQGQSEILSIISIGILLAIAGVVTLLRSQLYFWQSKMGGIAIGLVIGGAIGNLIDRLTSGYVTDFIDIGPWPVFNLADSAVVVGIGILLYLIFFTQPNKDSANGNKNYSLRH